jgi:membrane protein involved in D-alanine export
MLPYTDLPYFVVILGVALPAVLLGILGRSRAGWILVAAALMAVVHHGTRGLPAASEGLTELAVVAAFAAFQLALIWAFARFRKKRRSRLAFSLAVGASLAPLVAAKLGGVLDTDALAGFVGISYVTFRAIDALIVVQDGLEPGLRPAAYLAYLLFPATVSAGPIDRYRRFVGDFERIPSRRDFLESLDSGIGRLFDGLLFKFVIAALIHDLVVAFETSESVLGVIAYMYVYSAFLYFDFAGYSAIAVGVSRCFGIQTPENFDHPYRATDIADFWRRWHISLSTWFRDHVYMRFVMAATRRRWFRGNRYSASAVGFLLTFGLMGAWHGLAARYLVYGAYHALLLIGHQAIGRWSKRHPELAASRSWEWLGRAATLNAVCFGFLIFSGRLG